MKYPPQPIPLISRVEPDQFYAQPKFDGWRVVRENRKFYTRHGNELPQHILSSMLSNTTDADLDLELVSSKGRHTIPTILSGNDAENCGRLILLDIIEPDTPIEERILKATSIAEQEDIEFAPITEAESWDHINSLLDKAFAQEYGAICDGLVLKKKGSTYPISHRGPICYVNCIKIKTHYE